MSDTRAAIRELRSLNEQRSRGELNDVQTARLGELRAQLGLPPEPVPADRKQPAAVSSEATPGADPITDRFPLDATPSRWVDPEALGTWTSNGPASDEGTTADPDAKHGHAIVEPVPYPGAWTGPHLVAPEPRPVDPGEAESPTEGDGELGGDAEGEGLTVPQIVLTEAMPEPSPPPSVLPEGRPTLELEPSTALRLESEPVFALEPDGSPEPEPELPTRRILVGEQVELLAPFEALDEPVEISPDDVISLDPEESPAEPLDLSGSAGDAVPLAQAHAFVQFQGEDGIALEDPEGGSQEFAGVLDDSPLAALATSGERFHPAPAGDDSDATPPEALLPELEGALDEPLSLMQEESVAAEPPARASSEPPAETAARKAWPSTLGSAPSASLEPPLTPSPERGRQSTLASAAPAAHERRTNPSSASPPAQARPVPVERATSASAEPSPASPPMPGRPHPVENAPPASPEPPQASPPMPGRPLPVESAACASLERRTGASRESTAGQAWPSSLESTPSAAEADPTDSAPPPRPAPRRGSARPPPPPPEASEPWPTAAPGRRRLTAALSPAPTLDNADDEILPLMELADALLPEAAEAPFGSSDALNPTFVQGEHRVILHLLEGQVKRGTVQNLDLLDTAVTLLQPGAHPERIPMALVKALFFMLGPGASMPRAEGHRVRVTFHDGRQVVGYSEEPAAEDPGFFVVPADTRTNTARIYVLRAAVRSLTQE